MKEINIQQTLRNLGLCLFGLIIGSFAQSTWTVQNSGTTNNLYSVTWTGNQFVAVGYPPTLGTVKSATILTSPDGIAWTARNSGITNILWSVTWADSQLVAVGDSGAIITSPDGITWTARSSGTKNVLNSVTWADSQLVAVGGNSILTSPDGVTWTARDSGTTWNFFCATWTGKKWVVAGIALTSGAIWTSPDGITWTSQYSDIGFVYINSITWTGSQFVFVASSPTSLSDLPIVETSPDGSEWAARAGTGNSLSSVIWTGSQLVAVGDEETIETSSDGIKWTERDSGEIGLHSVISSGSQLVAVGYGGTILTSPQTANAISPYRVSNSDLNLRIGQDALYFSIPNFTQKNISSVIYSLSGREAAAMRPAIVPSIGESHLPIDQLSPGQYLFELKVDGKRYTSPFEITR